MILFINSLRNYLIAEWWIAPWNGKSYDSGYKMIVTIMWNPGGFRIVDTLPKGQIFNAGYTGGKRSWAPAILLCDKNSDDLLMSNNIVVSLMLNNLCKTFNQIKEDRLDVFECRIFPDLCYGLQPSEMIRLILYSKIPKSQQL
jgi:hypothetical protein